MVWSSLPVHRCVAYSTLLPVLLAFTLATKASIKSGKIIGLYSVWASAGHSAFTDLERFDNRWIIAFREASSHAVPRLGEPGEQVRILSSLDGKRWRHVTVLDAGEGRDLRDPKLSVTAD
jgi:hypothetical protein